MRILPFFAVFVIIFLRAPAVQAQINKDYAFSLSPQVGVFFGHVEELVYPTNTKGDLLSLLLWDIKSVFYYGLLMEFFPVNPMEGQGVFFGLSMKYGIPGPSGRMEDKDWRSVENADLTNFSSHNNITKEIFQLDFSTGYSFPVRSILLIKTFVNISYMKFRFNAENGYGIYARETPPYSGIYAPIDDDPREMTFNDWGTVISYSQEWFCAAPGVSLCIGHKGIILAEISFMITPLVFCVDLDEHKKGDLNIGRDIQFRDSMRGGIMIEPGFKLSMPANKWLNISCDISWRFISGTRGPSYISSPIGSGNYEPAGESGAGLSILNTALTLKVRL